MLTVFVQDVSISTPSRRGKTPSTGYEGQQQPPSLALFDPTVRAAAVAAAGAISATGTISATSTPSVAHSTSLAGVPPSSSSYLAANTPGDMLSPVSTYGTPSAPSPPSQTETPVLTFPSPHQQQEAFTARLYQDVVGGGQGSGGARATQQQQQQQQQQLATIAAAVPLLRPQSPAHSRAAADTYSDAWIPTPACKQVGFHTAYRRCNF
jgi:hypothetical protein